MQRLLVTYRWELWLLGGIPFIFTIAAIMLPAFSGGHTVVPFSLGMDVLAGWPK